MTIIATHRDCRKCGKVKPLEEFQFQKGCKFDRRPYCKECQSAINSSPERKIWKKAWRNSTEQAAKESEYRKSEARRKTLQKHAQTDAFKKTQKKWIASNTEKKRVLTNSYRGRQRQQTPAWANRKYINIFYQMARDETKRTGSQVEVDHIVPLNGELVCGLHVEHNLQLLFKNDNCRKNNKVVGL